MVIKTHTIFFIILLGLAFVTCENTSDKNSEKPILCSFIQPFEDKGVNLNRILGDSIIIKREGVENIFYINYSRANNITTINDNNGNELYKGPVGRYRGYYYFTQNSPDSMFWISAMEINDNQIKGFLEPEIQMRLLDDTLDYWLNTEAERPQFLTKANENGISIIPDKKLLNSLFTHILSKLPFDTLIYEETIIEKATTELKSTKDNKIETQYDLVESLYPNPASQQSKLVFKDKGKYQVFIYDLTGKSIQDRTCNCTEMILDLSNMQLGIYNVVVTKNGKKPTDTIKLIRE